MSQGSLNRSAEAGNASSPPSELRDLCDAVSDLIVAAAPSGKVSFLNATAQAALGYSAEEAEGLWLTDLLEPAVLEQALQALDQVYRLGRSTPLAGSLRDKQGRAVPMTGCLLRPTGEAEGRIACGVFRLAPDDRATDEVTRRQSLAETQIIRNVAREKQLTELKAHFISMASHELRTPLAALALGVDFLAKYWPKLSPDQIKKNLKTVDVTVRQLRSVLDSVLIISSEDEGRLRCARAAVELVAFCRKISEEAAAADEQLHPIVLKAGMDRCEAQVDPQLLSHILTNLLSNACKYSAAASPVELVITRQGGAVTIAVSDHGIGIPEEDRPRLFDLFFRGSNVGNIAGTGLGLVVVRRCVEAHNGSLAIDGVEGGGTRVAVTLPLLT